MDGAVNWIRLDNVPVMGRLVVLQPVAQTWSEGLRFVPT